MRFQLNFLFSTITVCYGRNTTEIIQWFTTTEIIVLSSHRVVQFFFIRNFVDFQWHGQIADNFNSLIQGVALRK